MLNSFDRVVKICSNSLNAPLSQWLMFASGGSSVVSLILAATLFLGSFLVSLVLTPRFLYRLRNRGFIVEDIYKAGKPAIITHMGLLGLTLLILILVGTMFLRVPSSLFLSPPPAVADPILVAQLSLFVICGYGIVGADRKSVV